MKAAIYRLLLFLPPLAIAIPCNLLAEDQISTDQWQEDLRFLQKTIHDDYASLFRKVDAATFDRHVEQLHDQMPELSPHECLIGINRIVGLFQYGHTDVGIWNGPVTLHRLPIQMYEFSDGVSIQGAHRDYQQLLGAKVTKIAGVPIAEALARVRPVTCAENDQYLKAHGYNYLCVPEVLHAQGIIDTLSTSVPLTVYQEGKHREVTVSAVANTPMPIRFGWMQQEGDWLDARRRAEAPFYLRDLEQEIYDFEYLADNKTVHIRHTRIRDEETESIEEFYERVFRFIEENDVERLVLDLRLNGGGNNYKNKPIVTGIIQCRKINQHGRLFVVLGRRTFSACQNLVNELDNYTHACFVGEPTSENINFFGDTNRVTLPHSRVPVFLSFAWWQDKPQWENAEWLAPDIAVELSFEEYRDNQDPIIATINALSEDEPLLQPARYVNQLASSALEPSELTKKLEDVVGDHKLRFFDFEDHINRSGYDLLEQDADRAVALFKLNTRLFPKSANAWDSLGEGYWKLGDKTSAIASYDRSIQLDPDGDIGANSRKMLSKIQDMPPSISD